VLDQRAADNGFFLYGFFLYGFFLYGFFCYDTFDISEGTKMADITAKLVNELRSRTNQPMMDCKKMLVKTNGDIDEAIAEFRKKGIKASLGEREASEGRVAGAFSADGKISALVELNCNTDFTAKSEPFLKLANKAAALLVADPSQDVTKNAEVVAGAAEVSQTTGENIRVGKSAVVTAPNGKAALYLYTITGKIGVIMAFAGDPSDELVTQLGGHIAFTKPAGLTRESVDPALVAKERDIAVEAAKATGKPQAIAEKIAEGKLNAFFGERVLLDQEFFNAQLFKGSVANYLKENKVTLEKYTRLEVGQA
jgi:elongation factor Ts